MFESGPGTKYSKQHVSPVDGAFLFGHHRLEVGELQEAVVEVVQVENAGQQEGGGDEDFGEQHRHRESLQAQVLQTAPDLRKKRPIYSLKATSATLA